MSKKQQSQLPPNTIIEVVMTKEMTYADYMKMYQQAKNKGWHVQGYQIGFRTKRIEN